MLLTMVNNFEGTVKEIQMMFSKLMENFQKKEVEIDDRMFEDILEETFPHMKPLKKKKPKKGK